MANVAGNPMFNVPLPKMATTDRQKEYEQVVKDNEDLLKSLTDTIHRYCLDGSCQKLGLLLRAVSYLFQFGEQIILDSNICSQCGDRGCSTAGNGEGLDN